MATVPSNEGPIPAETSWEHRATIIAPRPCPCSELQTGLGSRRSALPLVLDGLVTSPRSPVVGLGEGVGRHCCLSLQSYAAILQRLPPALSWGERLSLHFTEIP